MVCTTQNSPSGEAIPQHDALNRGTFGGDRLGRGRRSVSIGPRSWLGESATAATATAAAPVIRFVLLVMTTAAAAPSKILRLGSEAVVPGGRRWQSRGHAGLPLM